MPVARSAARRLIVVGTVGLLIVAGFLLIVRSALEPAALRAAAETRLTAMLGQPVGIGAVRVTLFPAAVVGSNIRVGAGHGDAPALELLRVRIVPRLRSLIGGPVAIEEVRLEGLVISVLRDRAGRWHMPAAVPAPTADAQSGVVIERVRLESSRIRVFDRDADGRGTATQVGRLSPSGLREASSIEDIEASAFIERGALRLSPLAGRIGNARVKGEARLDRSAARMDLELQDVNDSDLPALLGLAGTERPSFLRLLKVASASLSVRIDRTDARLSGSGSVNAPGVAVDPLKLDAFEAPYKIEGARLIFEPTTFTLNRGTHRGGVSLDLAQTPARWSLDSRVADLDLGDFLGALTARDPRIDGTAVVQAVLHGRVGEPLDRTVQGRAHIVVADGIIRQFPLLATVNRALRLAEEQAGDTRFERLSASLALAGGAATTSDLVLQAADIRVEAAGRIGFDRSLELAGQAVVSPARSAAAVRSVHELSALRNADGELELPLTITGTVDNPSFNVDIKRALGKSLRNELERRLRGLIRRE
jgi:uncharacterized protein involved in outer membrane biogenesis